MFEKTLTDMIRGLRANKKNETKYISIALEEIRKELKSVDIDVKSNAINKLIYLQMLGYDMSWASFNVIEVMSSSKFVDKRIGYLAASQSFSPDTDVLMLATNLIKKDMASQNHFDVGVALNGLANVANTDLARDLSSDVVNLLTHSKAYVRKKAVLALYKVFLRFPEALRPAFPRLKDKLADDDPSVVSAAVNVICELARKNPKNYLAQAPQLFKILTDSSNNWMLIKIIKLFGALIPLEPRLSKKLAEPISNIISSTSAMSLLYECINTVTQSEMDDLRLVKLCIQKLRIFIEDPDQNLKYLGLLALSKFLSVHPKIVSEHNDVILKCIDDDDVSIRYRALDLLVGMVTKKNLPDVVRKLLSQLDSTHVLSSDPAYRTEMVKRIVELSAQNSYQHVTDFEWFINVLVKLCKTEGANQGKLLSSQILDVAVRVKVVREFIVKEMLDLLQDERLYGQFSALGTNREVLSTASWIVGEYASALEDPVKAINILTNPVGASLPGFIQASFVQNAFKIIVAIAANEDYAAELPKIIGDVVIKLTTFTQSSNLEVQERASIGVQLLKLANDNVLSYVKLVALAAGELNPVAKKAQLKVPLPADFDIEEWIDEPIPDNDNDVSDGDFHLGGTSKSIDFGFLDEGKKSEDEDDEDEKPSGSSSASKEDHRKHQPFYLGSGSSKKNKDDHHDDVDSIPIAKLDLGPGKLEVAGGKKGKKGKKGSKKEEPEKHYEITKDEEMPEGADNSDDEDPKKKNKKKKGGKAFTLESDFDVDLTTPLGADEQLPTLKAYATPEETRKKAEEAARKRAEEEAKARKAKKTAEKEAKKAKEDKKAAKDEKKAAKEDKKKKKQAEAAAAPAVVVAKDDDLLGFLEDIPAPKSAAPVAAADTKKDKAAASSSKTPKAAVPVAAAAPAAPEKKSKKAAKDTDDKKKKKKKATTASEDLAAIDRAAYEDVAQLEGAVGADSEEPPLPPTYQVLVEDDNLRLTYAVDVDGNKPNLFTTNLIVENLSSGTLTNIEFSILETLNLKIEANTLGFKDGAIKVPFNIFAEEQNQVTINFNVKLITQSQSLKSVLTYSLQKGDVSSSHNLNFKLQFNASAFVVPESCDAGRFAQLLGESNNYPAHVNTKLPLAATRSFRNAVAVIGGLLHVGEVTVLENGASMYGRTVQDHHVALLVKALAATQQISIDIKASDASLAAALKAQIEKEFY